MVKSLTVGFGEKHLMMNLFHQLQNEEIHLHKCFGEH